MRTTVYIIAGLLMFGIAREVGQYYPGIVLQWIVAYVLYWIGGKIVSAKVKPQGKKDNSRKKLVYVLTALGLLGLLVPFLGFLFVLPAFLIAKLSISKTYSQKRQLQIIAGIILLLCILNANYGSYLSAAH